MADNLNIHFLQQVPYEVPGTITEWASGHNHNTGITGFYGKYELPDISSFDWLIIMGGPMNIYEEAAYPWLKEEKEFIRRAIDSEKTVIGICLGSQLIADALGAKVFRNGEREIGWFDVELSVEAEKNRIFHGLGRKFETFHWHGDTFDIPANAIRIGSSEGCRNQGFIYFDKVFALQFHLETTRPLLQEMLDIGKADLAPGKYVQNADHILKNDERFISNRKILFEILDRISGSVK